MDRESDVRLPNRIGLFPLPEFNLFHSKKRLRLLGIGILATILIGVLEYYTGPELSFAIFYLLPVVLVTWHAGFWHGVILSAISIFIWQDANILMGVARPSGFAFFWNTFVLLSFDLIVVYLLSSIRFVYGNLEQIVDDRTNQLTTEIQKRIETEAELRNVNEELEQRVERRTSQLANALNEMEGFSYSVSHDLRAPLRAISGFSHALMEEAIGKLSYEERHYLTRINDNAIMMGRLVDELLAFAQLNKKELTMVTIDMTELANEVMQVVRQNSKEGERVSTVVCDLPLAKGDRVLIRQVLINLVSNAIKFSRYTAAAHVEIGGDRPDHEAVYYVRDNGAGFDMAYVNKLFRVFERLHPDQFEGIGVGLAFSKRIIERHGGRMWANGEMGKGATFYFTLPPAEVGAE